ncbi:hypothetical protein SAXI111661_03920 [Saccharomonospora xinjiangensis]|nr:hypothetical protein EYD13_06595 [Saccharomonospora xinjiangensis]
MVVTRITGKLVTWVTVLRWQGNGDSAVPPGEQAVGAECAET